MVVKLSAAQAALLQKVLRRGGKVVASMGANKPHRVNKVAAEKLVNAGLLACQGRHPNDGPGCYPVDLIVTAAGCLALNAFQQAKA